MAVALTSLMVITNDLIDEIILPFGYEFIVKVEKYGCYLFYIEDNRMRALTSGQWDLLFLVSERFLR